MAAVMNGNVQGIQIGAKSRPAVDVANLILVSGFACPITGVEALLKRKRYASKTKPSCLLFTKGSSQGITLASLKKANNGSAIFRRDSIPAKIHPDSHSGAWR